MSQQTFCDRCGRRCRGNKRGHLHLAEIHFTSDGEHVGEDEWPSVDLCWRCLKLIKETLGRALTAPRQRPPALVGEDTAIAPRMP